MREYHSSLSAQPPPPSPAIAAPSTTFSRPSSIAPSASKKQTSTRRTLSCLPCRQHKLKCDRHVPCRSCSRYRREDQCRQNPAPSSVLNGRSVTSTPSQSWAAPALSTNHSNPPTSFPVDHDAGSAAPPHPPRHPPPPPPAPVEISQSNGTISAPHMPSQCIEQSDAFGSCLLSSASSSDAAVPPHSTPFFLTVAPNTPNVPDINTFWRNKLLSVLPQRKQCDLLVTYYTDHMDWVYHAIHHPSFYKTYAQFWESQAGDVDLIWLSLLYTILSCGALYLPFNEAETVGLDKNNLRNLAHVWHSASRQALHVGGFEAKPCVTQLQTFIVTQLYWLATRNVETLNSCLGQAIRNAQALGLDKDAGGANPLDTHIRRLIWWELFNCDAYQSVCLTRAPLVYSDVSKVPFPLNCNDAEATEASVIPRPLEEPTDASANILRAKVFIIFRKLFVNDSELMSSYDYVQSIDAELEELIANFPWYFQTESCQHLLPHRETIVWEYHMVHSLLCMQRIRMHRPFLQQQTSTPWNICAKSARDVLSVYKILRTPDIERLRRSQKFYVQAYQIYSAAVAQAAFLLVERSFPVETIRNDIEMVISDLSLGGLGGVGVSTMADGKKILMTMLDMSDRKRRREPLEPESLVPEISAVFGGEQTTRKYLTRCDIGYVLNRDSTATGTGDDRGDPRTVDGGAVPITASASGDPFIYYPTQGPEFNDLSQFLDSSDNPQFDVPIPFDIMDTEQWEFLLSSNPFNA